MGVSRGGGDGERGGVLVSGHVQETVNEGGCQFGNVQVRVKEGVWEFVVIEVNGCVGVC